MGRLVNGIKYIFIAQDNNLKKKSLEDNLYYTLMDIFWNANHSDDCMISNGYSRMLTGDTDFVQRSDDFQYTNVLQKKYELEKILRWLNSIKEGFFDFTDQEEGEETNEDTYMRFDDWWVQFQELRCCIIKKKSMVNNQKNQDISNERKFVECFGGMHLSLFHVGSPTCM